MLLHFEIKIRLRAKLTDIQIRTQIEDDEAAMYFYRQKLHEKIRHEILKIHSAHDVHSQTWTLAKTSFIVEFSHLEENVWRLYNELIPQAIMDAVGKCQCNYSYQEFIENPELSEADFIFVVRAIWKNDSK